MKTIKNIIEKPVKELGILVLYVKRKQESALKNSNILAVLDGHLGKAMETQNRTPLDYGSELYDITGI